MTAYDEGFIKTCAALGVDPAALLKEAAAATPLYQDLHDTQRRQLTAAGDYLTAGRDLVPARASVPQTPALAGQAPATNATSAAAVPVKKGPRKITWEEVRRGVRNAPRDPESQPLTFEPQNFWKNLKGGLRKALFN